MLPDITAIIKEMVSTAVEEKMGELSSIADAMVRMHGEFITVEQAARLLNRTPATIWRMCEDGRLTCTKEGSTLIMVRSMVNMVRDGDITKLEKPRKPCKYNYHRVSP